MPSHADLPQSLRPLRRAPAFLDIDSGYRQHANTNEVLLPLSLNTISSRTSESFTSGVASDAFERSVVFCNGFHEYRLSIRHPKQNLDHDVNLFQRAR